MRLVAYVRVSTTGQLDGYGIASQLADINRWATANGHTISTVCEDVISGTTDALDRPGLACVLDADVDGVVIARLDRLARALHVQEAALALIWRQGASVFTADSGEVLRDDPDDPARRMIRQVLGAIAEMDRQVVINRLAAGRRAKTRAGGHGSGRYPYGHSKTGPIEAEQATLAVITASRKDGKTWKQVANALNADGLLPRHAGTWSDASVRKVAG